MSFEIPYEGPVFSTPDYKAQEWELKKRITELENLVKNLKDETENLRKVILGRDSMLARLEDMHEILLADHAEMVRDYYEARK